MVTEQSSRPRAGGSSESRPPTLGSVGVRPQRRKSAAHALAPLVASVLGGQIPVRVELWDGSGFGPTDGPGTIHVRSADAFATYLVGPG